MALHCGRDSTYKRFQIYFSGTILKAMSENLSRNANNVRSREKLEKYQVNFIASPLKQVMQQIDIDICSLPEVHGFKHLDVCIDYFSKWLEAKPIKYKSTSTVAQFLYEVIYRHGRMKIQINDQGRELVNEVSKVLHNMIGTEQRITSVYHAQSNGFCKRQNRTIKDSLVKVLDGNPCDWPDVIEGVLLAHRGSKYTSTKFSPFFLMYNREPNLPIDVKFSLVGIEGNESEHPFDKESFDAVLTIAISMRANIHQTAGENICSAQEKQRRDYNRRHQVPNKIKVDQK